jgi:hypothetical protein
MTRKIKPLILLLLFALMAACENDPVLIPEDVNYVAFSKGSLTLPEDGGSFQIELYYVTFSSQSAVVAIEASTQGLASPAVEGVDFNLIDNSASFLQGHGFAHVTLEILDNEVFEGSKQFFLVISSAPAGARIGIDGREKILITIADDEHPLSKFKGNYTHEHINYYGSDWNYTSVSTININPENVNQILISNICSTSLPEVNPIVATIDEENQEIIIESKQIFSEPNGNGYTFAFNAGIPGVSPDNPEPVDERVIGTYTINEETSEIVITLHNWGPKWMEPDGTTYDGWWWYDFFTVSTMSRIVE